MTSRRSVGTLLGVFWLLALGLLVLAVVLFDDTRLSHRTGFPYMPSTARSPGGSSW